MHFKIRFFVIIALIVFSGCLKSKIDPTKGNMLQTVKDFSYLKPHIYEKEDEKFSEERNVQMGKQYEGLRVFGGLRHFIHYAKPIKMDNLGDYLTNIPKTRWYDRIISLFYDTRTITLNKQDLTELFELWKSDVYVSIFETQFDNGLNVRVYNILDDPLVPTERPVKIIQTWDDKEIYCQQVDTYLPRRFTDIIPLRQPEESDKLLIWCYNLGVRGQDLSTELQYWEFRDSRWLPCELEFEMKSGFELEEYFFREEKRSNLSNTVYKDGIAFYRSVYASDSYLFEKIEIIKENKVFRVSAKDYPEYYVDLTFIK